METIPRNVHSAFLCTSTTLPDSCSASSLPRPTSSCSLQTLPLVFLSLMLQRQVWDGVRAPMAQCPRSQCHCSELWLLQGISPSPTAPSSPTAPPMVSPGWAEQGSLFHVVAINSTTASTSPRCQATSSSQSLIVISDNKTKSSKGKREY